MYCKECKVNVRGNLPVCPLCHEVLTENDSEDIFPKQKHKIKKDPKKIFSKIYLFTALNLFIIFSVFNYIFIKKEIYSLFAFAILTYIYIFVRQTILSRYTVGKRVVVQSIVTAILCYIIQLTFNTDEWLFTFALPIINIVASLTLGIYILTAISKRREHLFSMLLIAILGFIPLLVYIINKDKIIFTIPIIISTITSCAVLTSLIIFSSKDLLNELKKKFHL